MTRLANSDCMLCHDGSIEGFLTMVFRAYAMHIMPAAISQSVYAQPSLGQEVVDVEADISLAERVKVGICNKAGYGVYRNVERAFLSCLEGREMDIFAYVVMAMEGGRKAVSDPSNPVVYAVERMVQTVANEAEDIRQFVRFQLLENGVYFATVNPKCDVLPIVTSYFVERFNTQPFMIYDEAHHLAAVYDMRRSYFVKTDELTLPDKADCEIDYQRLWKMFYDSVNNEQRFSPGLRRNNMPQRFWRNLTEMQLAVSVTGAA